MNPIKPPERLFKPDPNLFKPGSLCGKEGQWHTVLACARCRSTVVRLLGEPTREMAGVESLGRVALQVRVFFECEQGHVFTVSFHGTACSCDGRPPEVWVGCHWADPIISEEPELESAGRLIDGDDR